MWRYFALLLPFLTIHGIIPFCGGLVPGYYGVTAYLEDSQLREKGELVEAHITHKEKLAGEYHIQYSWVDTKGVEFHAERDLGREYTEMINTNDYFLITYLPSNPRIHMLGDKSSSNLKSSLALALLALALVLCGYGIWGLSRGIYQLLAIRFLFTKGKTGNALVGDWINPPGKGGPVKDSMTFHFVAANGRWYEGRSRRFGAKLQQKWPKGAHIKVAYDAVNPLKCEPDVFELLK